MGTIMKKAKKILVCLIILCTFISGNTFSNNSNNIFEIIKPTTPQIEITNETVLQTTLSSLPREISLDVLYSGFPVGYTPVIEAAFYISIDTGYTFTRYTMADSGGFHFIGEIPGYPENKLVMYIYEANETTYNLNYTTVSYSYQEFIPSAAKTLLVLNGYNYANGFPQSFYFGSGEWPANLKTLDFQHDTWSYGKLTPELLNYYDNVIEICGIMPYDINNDTISTWLGASGSHNYMLAGQEWLGIQSHWTNGPHMAGDFIFDILGINYEYNDINYEVIGDAYDPTIVYLQQYSLLGGPIFNTHAQVCADSNWNSPMTYDPYYELDVYNWIDGVDFVPDVQIDMKALGKDGNTYNIAGHRTLPAGNKIAFLTYDPLTLDSDTENQIEYFWYGFMNTAPHAEPLLNWFGVILDVEEENTKSPKEFNLSQNYPNPFNPSTKISWQSPVASHQTLKIYDMLGNEVAKLVDEEKPAGSYTVSFDGSKLASGVYFYQLKAGDHVETKKMILMK